MQIIHTSLNLVANTRADLPSRWILTWAAGAAAVYQASPLLNSSHRTQPAYWDCGVKAFWSIFNAIFMACCVEDCVPSTVVVSDCKLLSTN